MTDLSFDIELEERLRDLSQHVPFPPTPAIASAVLSSIETERRTDRSALDRGRLVFWAAAVLVLIATAIAAIPSTRHAVARWFDIPGIHISWSNESTRPDVQAEIRLGLGASVSIDDAVDSAGFTIKMPTIPTTTTPGEIFYNPSTPGGLVSFVYVASDDLPVVEGTDVGLLITQFAADPDSVWASKALFAGREMDVVRINGLEAMWFPDTHVISIQPEGAGEVTAPFTRSTGSVLLWNHDGVTYRIEGNIPRDEMIAIAESMEPIAP